MTAIWNRTRGIFHSPRTLALARYIDIDGIGGWDFVHFSAEIWLLRESECDLVLTHASGEVVKKDGTYNDFYGFLTSPREQFQRFQAWTDRYAGSGLQVELRLTVTDSPVLRKPPEMDGHAPQYIGVPNDWMVADPEIEAARKRPWNERSENTGEFFRPTVVLEDVLLSSTWEPGERLARAQTVLDRAVGDLTIPEAQRRSAAEMFAPEPVDA